MKNYRPAPGVLRILVIVFAVISGVLSATFGALGINSRSESITLLESKSQAEIELTRLLLAAGNQQQRKQAAMMDLDQLRLERYGFILMAANIVITLVSCACVEVSRGWMAAVLMLMAPVGPAIIMPVSLIFTALFVPTALVSFLVWRRKPLPEKRDD
jgi:hypothetical protein